MTEHRSTPVPPMPPAPYPGTQAITRAVAILRMFSDARPEWRISELARAVALHKTTTFRLLAALEREGLVARSPAAGCYHLGPAAIALGAQAIRSSDLRTAAHEELLALAARSGETTTLEILVGEEVLIVDEVQSGHVLGSAPCIGTRWPAHATSTGKVLLAARGGSGVGAAGGGGATAASVPTSRRLARVTPHSITSAARLARELEQVRRRGYATNIEELEPGFAAIGAPVRDHEQRVVAAVSVGGPLSRLPTPRILELALMVRQAADRISARLGAAPRLLGPAPRPFGRADPHRAPRPSHARTQALGGPRRSRRAPPPRDLRPEAPASPELPPSPTPLEERSCSTGGS